MKPQLAEELRSALSPRDLAILTDIDRFRFLSTRQIQRLHFSGSGAHASLQGATRAAHRVLHRLQLARLITAIERRIGGPERGSAGFLWQLDERGAGVLHLGAEVARKRLREPSSGMFVRHTVAIAELAVALTETIRSTELELVELQPEPASWRSFLGGYGQAESLRPDLYVVVANEQFEQHAFVEIDQATEHQPQILRKCHVYARYVATGAAEKQDGVVPQVLWVTTTKARSAALQRMIASDPKLPSELFRVVLDSAAAEAIIAGLNEEAPTS